MNLNQLITDIKTNLEADIGNGELTVTDLDFVRTIIQQRIESAIQDLKE